MLRLLAVCMLLAAATLFAGEARAERRVALVVGNAAYEGAAALRTARNDAKDMAEALKKLGFETVLGLDLDQDHFASTMETFARALDGADIGLFFYAGHGLQIDERNYLVSVNAQLSNEFLISSETIELDAIVRLMESKVATNIVLLDASPQQSAGREPQAQPRGHAASQRRSATGLARIEPASRDTMVAYAAAPGQEAADGGEGNSPFTAALLKRIAEPGLEISVMLKQVTADVRAGDARQAAAAAARRHVAPGLFRPDGPGRRRRRAGAERPAAPSPPRNVQSAEDRSLEIAFWTSARTANECDAMRAYLQRYPKGVFVELAKLCGSPPVQAGPHRDDGRNGAAAGAAARAAAVPAPQAARRSLRRRRPCRRVPRRRKSPPSSRRQFRCRRFGAKFVP